MNLSYEIRNHSTVAALIPTCMCSVVLGAMVMTIFDVRYSFVLDGS